MDYSLSSISKEGTSKLTKLTLSDEGYRQFRYPDSKGIWTFGIGFKEDLGLSLEECLQVLKVRLCKLEQDIIRNIPLYLELSEARKIIIFQMCYQMGVAGVCKFTEMLNALREKDYFKAAQEILDSELAKETPNRAAKYAMVMEVNRL